MRARRVLELRPPDQVLRLEEIPEPPVEPGTVKIHVEAAALNFLETSQRQPSSRSGTTVLFVDASRTR